MKNQRSFLSLSLSLCLSLCLFSCASADKMLDRGDYDGLIKLAVKKLSGKKKNDDYVKALEKGFEKVTKQDMARIESMYESNRAEDWEDVLRITTNIDKRQDRIDPLLPLVSESGYHAKFSFVRTDEIVTEARTTAINLYEKRLMDLVTGARKGNKTFARDAYNLIDRMRSISSDYLRPELREEMHELGVNHIFVQIENNSRTFLPLGLEDELLSADFGQMGGSWDRFYTYKPANIDPDFQIVLNILDIAATPDELLERQFQYTKEIVDGWEYVLDSHGNVVKDSLGNDIKRDKLVRVNATVVEQAQGKRAVVRARVDIFNSKSGSRICSENFEVEEVFAHVARNIFGDDRALEPNQSGRVLIVPFPSESALIWDAFKSLKPKFFEEIRHADFTPGYGT